MVQLKSYQNFKLQKKSNYFGKTTDPLSHSILSGCFLNAELDTAKHTKPQGHALPHEHVPPAVAGYSVVDVPDRLAGTARSRKLWLAVARPYLRPARLLLVPETRGLLQKADREAQEHRVPYQCPSFLPFLPEREPKRRRSARLQVLLSPFRHGPRGEEERPRRGFHAQRRLHRKHQSRRLSGHF